jgi:hypothetical protein
VSEGTYTNDRPVSSSDPEQIREEIELTRASLSQDVNALADSVKPGNVAKRQADRLRTRAGSLKDRVMGATPDVGSSASGARDTAQDKASAVADKASTMTSQASSAAQQAPDVIRARTEGNPLAAGVIAFGVGWLVSSLLPATRVEEQATQKVKENAAPLTEAVTDSAKQAVQNLKEPAREAAESVKQSATDAAGTVKEESRSAASDVRDQAQDARDTVQDRRP